MDITDYVSEKDFQSNIIGLARGFGWLVKHTPTVQNNRGVWLTAIHGDSGGTDLDMVHPVHGLCCVELKTNKGRLTEGQKRWGEVLSKFGVWGLWRPRMEKEIYRFIQYGGDIPTDHKFKTTNRSQGS